MVSASESGLMENKDGGRVRSYHVSQGRRWIMVWVSDTFRKKCEQRLFTQQVMPFGEVKKRAATNPKWQWLLHTP